MKNRILTSAKAIIAAASLAFVASSPVNAAVIYIGDSQGNTAQYDTSTSTLSALGNLSGLTSPGQIIGIAYDEMSDSVLHLDRNGARLYSTHTGTGASSLVYSGALAQNFQGGAAKGGILYGIDESTQRLRGINLTGFVDAGITGDVLPNHSHALGKDATTGQLYVGAGGNGIREVSDAGVVSGTLLATPGVGFEDLAVFGDDFLVASYGADLCLVDGITGTSSIFLTGAQLSSVGLVSSISGVDLRSSLVTVSEPGVFGLMAVGMLGLAMLRRRRITA